MSQIQEMKNLRAQVCSLEKDNKQLQLARTKLQNEIDGIMKNQIKERDTMINEIKTSYVELEKHFESVQDEH